MKKCNIVFLILFFTLWLGSTAFGAITVGRIAYAEGQIYRFMDGDRSWIETSVGTPAGTLDVLTTVDNSRAELAFPNNIMVRLDQNTEIEILDLQEDGTMFALKTGLARFYNRSAATALAVDTAMGKAQVGPGSAVDVLGNERSVIISAVQGQATFLSVRNGADKLEVLSGATTLEFKLESIVAGRGPVDRDWDFWCGGREDLQARRMVHSQYLPGTMQEYAGVLEPNGNWNRIYYRGYYYWAWKPRYVAVGWSPYTTGYWSDWHGSRVWIDNNPWGWVTHHYGHWIETRGAWMWTPYVHVSAVPGVTVVGLNVSFGKRFRPYWHPGRVRWIDHDDYIGWLPLAPRETYYGSSIWGPRSVVVLSGAGFNIGLDLAHHSYIDHAVIIPKRYFHRRGAGAINNYNSVRIRNINKTRIIKNYKPITIFKGEQPGKVATGIKRSGKNRIKTAGLPGRRTIPGKITGSKRNIRRDGRVNLVLDKRVNTAPLRDQRQTVGKKSPGRIERRGSIAGPGKLQISNAGPERRTIVRKIENRQKTAPERTMTGMEKRRNNSVVTAAKIRQEKTVRSKGITAQISGRKSIGPQNNTVPLRQNRRKEIRRHAGKSAITDEPVRQNRDQNRQRLQGDNEKYAAAQPRKRVRQEKRTAGAQQYPARDAIRDRSGSRTRPDSDDVSPSFNNRRTR